MVYYLAKDSFLLLSTCATTTRAAAKSLINILSITLPPLEIVGKLLLLIYLVLDIFWASSLLISLSRSCHCSNLFLHPIGFHNILSITSFFNLILPSKFVLKHWNIIYLFSARLSNKYLMFLMVNSAVNNSFHC